MREGSVTARTSQRATGSRSQAYTISVWCTLVNRDVSLGFSLVLYIWLPGHSYAVMLPYSLSPISNGQRLFRVPQLLCMKGYNLKLVRYLKHKVSSWWNLKGINLNLTKDLLCHCAKCGIRDQSPNKDFLWNITWVYEFVCRMIKCKTHNKTTINYPRSFCLLNVTLSLFCRNNNLVNIATQLEFSW